MNNITDAEVLVTMQWSGGKANNEVGITTVTFNEGGTTTGVRKWRRPCQ